MKREGVVSDKTFIKWIAIIVVFFVLSGLFWFFMKDSFVKESICDSGYITDRFRTGQSGGLYYYFTLDDSNDVMVNEDTYYSYEIGGYYNTCN